VRASDRQILRSRYDFRCGYCGIREVDAGAELTVDHFQPRFQGGSDALDNLVYCCHACNEFKGDYWQPDSPRRVLHPLHDDLTGHIAPTDEDTLNSLTPTGEFHIRKLHLNRSELILHRREQRLLKAERATQHATLDRLLLLEHHIEILQTQVTDKQTTGE
jgi:hypothetical protein